MSKNMSYSFQVRKEIESLNSNMTDEELFSSKAFANYIQQALNVELLANPKLSGRQIITNFYADPNDQFTAATNNEYVISNMLSPLIRMAESREDKYYSNLGQIIHEGGHIWFTDFPAYTKWMEHFRNTREFKWWPRKPANKNADEFKDFLNKYPNFRKYIVNICKGLQNIEEDSHIEYCLSTVFGGSFMYGIKTIRDNIYKNAPDLEDLVSKVSTGQMSFPDLVLCILQSADFGYEVKMKDRSFITRDNVAQNLMKYLDDTQEIREALLLETNGRERGSYLNELLCSFWDYLPKPNDPQSEENNDGSDEESQQGDNTSDEDNQEGQPGHSNGCQRSDSNDGENNETNSENSGNPSSAKEELNTEEGQPSDDSASPDVESKDFTEQEVSDLINDLEQALSEMGGMSKMPSGKTKPVDLHQSEAEAKKNRERNRINGKEARSEEIKKAMKAIIADVAVQNVESRREKDLKKEAQKIYDQKNSVNETSDWKYEIERGCNSNYAYRNYQSSYDRVKQYSYPAKRQLERVFKLRKQEGKIHGYMMGSFDASSIYRTAYQNDGHNFTRRHEPDGDPDVVFGLLIDESGSMSGIKQESALDTSVLLDDILSKFGISYMIAGHHVFGTRDCTVDILKDFDEIEKNARYRLGLLSAIGSNRDGAAIAYCAERLLSRPEKKKVLIVISDGWPTNIGFHQSVDSFEDTRLTVNEYQKRGITIFGAIIDGDAESVRKIYGDKTMDLTNLVDIPKVLSGVVKRYVIK